MLVELNIIEGPYLKDLLDQPEALRRSLRELEPRNIAGFAKALTERRYHRVVLTGMGSSFYALYPLYLALSNRGISVLQAETSELIHYMPGLLDEHTLLIAVSQSGQSIEVVRLLELTNGRTHVIGITNDITSPLAVRSQANIMIQAGPESSVSCKTYVASLIALQWLAAILTGEDLPLIKEQLSQAAPAVQSYLSEWRTHVSELNEPLAEIRQIFITGRGSSLATAGTGGLILKESARFPAEGMSCAAFRHGPFEMVGPHALVLVYKGDERSESLNRRLALDIQRAGGRSVLVDEAARPRPFRIPKVPDSIRTVMEILPVQMISLALAARTGREAGLFELASKITAVE